MANNFSQQEDERHFLDRHRERLIQGVTMVLPVLDYLLQEGLVTQEQYDTVQSESTSQQMMRRLLQYGRGWSTSDKDILCLALRISNPGVTENLEGTSLAGKLKIESYNRVQEYKVQYMASVKQKYQLIKEHNSLPGETVDLDDRYAPLLMIRNHRNKEEIECEITSLAESHLEILEQRSSKQYAPTTTQALFNPNPKGISPVSVVLQGPAGIGKTMTTQKIMLDWASGNIYQDRFDFLFYLSCRELNTITGKVSLVGLLPMICGSWSREDMRTILSNSRKLLFIIDGFDELKWALCDVNGDCQDIFQETTVDVVLKSLIIRKYLPGVSLMITTRPLGLQTLDEILKDPHSCFVEVLGFTWEHCEEYINLFFRNKEDADKALAVIKDNEVLFTMCTVPIVCWIVCTVLKPQIKGSFHQIQSKTATSIYLLYLKGLIKYHGRNQLVQPILKKLCALAKEGVMNQRILFEKKDLETHGLSLSEIESVFLNENLFHVDIDIETCYSFIYLSVQECLAALYYVLDEDSGNEGDGDPFLPEICKGTSLPTMCQQNPHLTLAVRFLFGLLNESEVETFSKSTGCKISLRPKLAMRDWIMGPNQYAYFTDTICCLYETQDESFVRSILSRSSCLKLKNKRLKDARVGNNCFKQLCYCLQVCDRFPTIYIKRFIINPEDLEKLSPHLHTCNHLILRLCEFPRQSFVQTDNKEDKVWLAGHKTPKEGRYLADKTRMPSNLSWLANPKSAVQELTINHCRLSPLCCGTLQSVLITNRSLAILDLSDNHLMDSGVEELCEGLRHPGCTLRELSLERCGLTCLSCKSLQSVLISNTWLTKLNLSDNNLGQLGVDYLCAGLRNKNCHLQELRLCVCGVNPRSCKDLCNMLTVSRSLSRLDLSSNHLQDSGVKVLCEGLQDSRCILQELSLRYCHSTALCSIDLYSLLIINQSLNTLDLSCVPLGDSGVELLCESLKDPRCILRDLRLNMCGLTSSCCPDLCSVLVTNRSLTKLDLSYNNFEDSGVKLLCEGLRYPGCTLGRLRFICCNATFLVFNDIGSVISTNRILTSLETRIKVHVESNAEVDRWCQAFQTLGCTVQKIVDIKIYCGEQIWIHIAYSKR